MAINLTKGQALNLSKETNGNSKFQIRAKWDLGLLDSCDVDIFALLCDSTKKTIGDDGVVFYNNLLSKDGSVKHFGDSRDGAGDGWDEIMEIDFSKMNGIVKTVPVFVSIYQALEKGQNFGLVRNLVVDIFDTVTNTTVAEFIPELEASTSAGLVLGEFISNNGTFYFKALGTGYGVTEDILREYGAM